MPACDGRTNEHMTTAYIALAYAIAIKSIRQIYTLYLFFVVSNIYV